MVIAERHRAITDRAAKYLIYLAIAGGLLYAVNRLWFISAFPDVAFFHRSFDDLLALIVFIPLSYLGARKMSTIPPETRLNFWHIVIGWALFSLIFEGFVPRIMARHFSDWGDVLAYATGGLILWLYYQLALDMARIQTGQFRIIYYDGSCGICQAAANWSSRRTDLKSALPYKPFQMIDAAAQPAKYQLAKHTILVDFDDGRQLIRARAIGAILLKLKRPWHWFGWLLVSPVLLPITSPCYRLFARYRHKVSQWVGLNACVID